MVKKSVQSRKKNRTHSADNVLPIRASRPAQELKNFWNLGSTRSMTARIIPSDPSKEGGIMDREDVTHISSHLVTAKRQIADGDLACKCTPRDYTLNSAGTEIKICLSDMSALNWWADFVKSVPPKVINGSGYKLLAPGQDEEVLWRVHLRDPNLANPDKKIVEHMIWQEWRGNPIMKANFRITIGKYSVKAGTHGESAHEKKLS